MDLKITFDVTPALADVMKCLCRALELRSTRAHAFHCAAAHVEPQKADAPAKVENLAIEAPEPVDVPKPAPAPENAADAESEAVAAQIDEPATELVQPEPQAEQSTEPEPEPVEAPKAKRSHHKKAATEPAPSHEPEPAPAEPAPAEPAPAEPAPAEPAPAEPAPAEIPNAPTIDDVRAVGVKLGAAGKQSVIIDYLKSHGCKSLSQLDPGCYAELIKIGKAAL